MRVHWAQGGTLVDVGAIGDEAKPRLFQERFECALARLDNVADGRGMGMDAGIRELVAALFALGHGTGQSCEGHAMERRLNRDNVAWATGGSYIDVFKMELSSIRDERMRVAKATGRNRTVARHGRRKSARGALAQAGN
jgi:hypothetical protein